MTMRGRDLPFYQEVFRVCTVLMETIQEISQPVVEVHGVAHRCRLPAGGPLRPGRRRRRLPLRTTSTSFWSQATGAAAGHLLCGRLSSAPRRRITTIAPGGHLSNVLLDTYSWPARTRTATAGRDSHALLDGYPREGYLQR
jgi:hypothetical protein